MRLISWLISTTYKGTCNEQVSDLVDIDSNVFYVQLSQKIP